MPDEITPKNARTILGVVRTLQGKGQNYLTQPWGAREQALFRELADGLKKELRDQSPEASLTALDKAEEIFQQGAKVRESKWSQQALRLAKAGQYSEIPSAIANPNIALEDIPKIFKVVGKDAANNIRATVLADVTGTLRTPTGKFDPAAIAKKVNKYGLQPHT